MLKFIILLITFICSVLSVDYQQNSHKTTGTSSTTQPKSTTDTQTNTNTNTDSTSTQTPQPTDSQQQPKFEPINANCYSSLDVLNGVNYLGGAVDLLKLDSKENLFQLSCSEHKLNLQGKNYVPNGVDIEVDMQIKDQCSSLVADNMKGFESFKLQVFNTEIDTKLCNEYDFQLRSVAGELNPNLKQISKKLDNKSQNYEFTQLKYQNYSAKISDIKQVTLNPQFVKDLESLPQEFDQTLHIDFLKKYGTHFREEVIIGGVISQVGYTPNSYTSDKSVLSNNFSQYFAQELNKKNISPNHLPNQFLNPQPDQQFIQDSTFQTMHIAGGGSNSYNDLSDWVQNLTDKPALAEQKLLNITSLLVPELLPPAVVKNLPKIKKNVNQALKIYLIESSGCTDPLAINYNPNVQISDRSCYYSAFYASYQQASGSCTSEQLEKYQLLDPITNDYSCPGDSIEEQVSVYTFNSCIFKQYFCLRKNVPSDEQDLQQSLQLCQANSFTNIFYDDSAVQQYYCPNYEQSQTYFNIKFEAKNVIYTCRQSYCYKDTQQGVVDFSQKHIGTCSTYKVRQTQELEDTSCDGNCLIQYGIIKLADDCDLYQYICLRNTFLSQCVNQNN